MLQNKGETVKMVVRVLMFLLLVDVLGYVAWNLSGQVPVDSFYIGAITRMTLSQ